MDFERFIETGEGIVVFHLEDMPCATCCFATREVSSCDKYHTKPFAVMEGKAECPKYVQKSEP